MSERMIDLHSHSAVSDGTDTPTGVIEMAKAVGLQVVALTDHDTFDGLSEALDAGRRLGVEVFPGMEMSTRFEGASVHLLAYGMDPGDQALNAELAHVREGRDQRLPLMLDKLSDLGMPLTADEVMAQVGESPSIGRPHIADALIAKGYIKDRQEAFDKYLYDGGPAYVDRYATPLEVGIDLIHGAGGAAVIAHPWGRGSKHVLTPLVISRLAREHRLDGLEVDHADHGQPGSHLRAELRKLATDNGLLATGSSDYHGTGKDLALGCNNTSDKVYADLRTRVQYA